MKVVDGDSYFMQSIKKARVLLIDLPAASRDKVLGENAKKFFGI
jgi:hypothetical protein